MGEYSRSPSNPPSHPPTAQQYLIKTLQNLPDRQTWVRVILENPAILQSVNILVTYSVVR
ncbi:hypothetical protein [Microcoleus sp.]|uniref:hypothetical protein n=1 Tax=Microcoleus sp. TaxID=44472 RepID=UPI00403E3FF8